MLPAVVFSKFRNHAKKSGFRFVIVCDGGLRMEKNELGKCLTRLRDGDTGAFTEIYASLKKPVYTIVYRIVLSREDAEDITQEVFLKLFSSPPDSSVRNPRAWIFRIAHNLAIDALRTRHTATPEEDVPPADETDCERIALRLDLDAAMSKLSPQEREIVMLHTVGGLGYAEIAGITGLSLPATYRCYRSNRTAALVTTRAKLSRTRSR